MSANPYRDPAHAQAFRRYCETLVRSLPIPAPFDEARFCAALGAWRGRPIVLRPWPLRRAIAGTDLVSGFVEVEPERDVIYYERDTRRLHQQQIVAHEGAHLILDHRGEGITPDGLVAQLRRIAPHAAIRHVLWRAGADTPEEFEAETLGREILLHSRAGSAQIAPNNPQAALVLAMMEGLESDDG